MIHKPGTPAQPGKVWFNISDNVQLSVWLIFLTGILIPVAVVANFNMAYHQFQIEMAEHWIGYKHPVYTNGAPVMSAASLEKVYNSMAHDMNHICARVSGGRVINGMPEQVSGSGVIVAEQYLLTNYHVVGGATDVQVTVYTQTDAEMTYSASVVLSDRANDLALMKIDTATALPSATLGNSDNVTAGDMVFAMGNAFGTGNVFTTGVVCDSTQSFTVGGMTYNNMIRTESYTYPGSSGGPLADINGDIIGINTAIYNPQGKFTGISFAMPINRALVLLQQSGVPADSQMAAPQAGPGGPGMGVAFVDKQFALPAA
ncbi:MAG: trypsin-like peptidase domain-containing protein [Candidatus Omnitrophica bacterium]|nr:trypsin-like peptidase domain-containing protein [Candidatus Omnitrophota bacterium]